MKTRKRQEPNTIIELSRSDVHHRMRLWNWKNPTHFDPFFLNVGKNSHRVLEPNEIQEIGITREKKTR